MSNKMNVKPYLLLLAVFWFVGCAKYTDSTKLNITPGIGISNVVAIGMNSADVNRTTHDVVIDEYGSSGKDGCYFIG